MLEAILRERRSVGGDLVARVESVLLQEIRQRCRSDSRTGAALLGVSLPTYRRRMSSLGDRDSVAARSPASYS